MKKEIFKIMLISILSMLSTHSNACCEKVILFKENYLDNFQKDEVFFIKGVALDVFEYGRTIKVIEDLKGNLVDESYIFVWGAGRPSDGRPYLPTLRMEDMLSYNENDTLIMLLTKPYVREEGIETSDDYATFPCSFSVLKLSNGLVTGYIYTPLNPDILYEENIVSWKELQKELLNSTAIQSVETNDTIYQWNGTIFFENTENKAIKLLFYDLSGKLAHEATTTSNSYRPPILTKNIFICEININDKLHTIKYIVP